MKTKKQGFLKRFLPVALTFILLPTVLIVASNNLSERSEKENLVLFEQSIVRATVQCYAIEGFYPENISYIEENYGILIDRDRYMVDYQYIASNLLPDITVLPLSN